MNRPNDAEVHPDFDRQLPAGKEFFSIGDLAKLWSVSEKVVQSLVDDGSVVLAVDLAPTASKHKLTRIPRRAVVALLDARKDQEKLEALRSANRRQKK